MEKNGDEIIHDLDDKVVWLLVNVRYKRQDWI